MVIINIDIGDQSSEEEEGDEVADDDDNNVVVGLVDLPDCVLSSIYAHIPSPMLPTHRVVCSRFRLLCPGPSGPVQLRLRCDTGRCAGDIPALPLFLSKLGPEVDVELSVHSYCSSVAATQPGLAHRHAFDAIVDATSERGLTRLTKLSLHVDISTRAWTLPFESIAAIIACNTRLVQLSLRGVPLEEKGLGLLSEAVVVAGVDLQSLDLEPGNTHSRLSVHALCPLLRASSLTSLRLAGADLAGQGCAMLAECLSNPQQQVRSLKLIACNLGSGDLVCLGQAIYAKDLYELDLGNNQIGRGGGLVYLAPVFAGLTNLDLCGNFDGTHGLQAVSPFLFHLTRLHTLRMAANAQSDVIAVHANGDNAGANVNGDGTAAGLRIRILRLFSVSMVDLMARAPSELMHLDLSHIPLSNVGLLWLRRSSRSLETLRLDSTRLGTQGAMCLAHGLELLSCLRTLSVANNLIMKEGILALGRALMLAAPPLETLNLAGNNLGALGAICLASVLPSLTTLESLELCDNLLGVSGVNAVCVSLRSHSFLRTVQMRNNCLGVYGSQIASESKSSLILASTGLTELDIG